MLPSPFSKVYRYVWVSTWYAFAAVVVLLATVFAAARLLLPFAEQYNTEIGERLSQYLDQPVMVKALDAEWHGWGPALVLQDVALLDTASKQAALQFDKVRLSLDLLSSLRQWQPIFSQITLVGVDLLLTRNQQGQFSVAGLARESGGAKDGAIDSATGGAKDAANPDEDIAPFTAWLFSQGRLSLEDSNITWHDEMGAGRNLHFSAVNLSLRNEGDRHQLDAAVSLSRDLGKSLSLRVDMTGDPLSAKRRDTQMFVAGEHVHLAELFEPQSLAGVDVSVNSAGFRIWGRWQDGVMQSLTGDVDAGGLLMRPTQASVAQHAAQQTTRQTIPQKTVQQLQPPETQPPETQPSETQQPETPQADPRQALLLSRMAGHFYWRRTQDGWQFEGDDVTLARQSRQWQPARVSLNYSGREEGVPTVDAAFSYLQLEDIANLLSLFTVGGEALQQPLQTIDPRGDIRQASLHWQGGGTPQYRAYATLHDATVNAWRNIPEARHVDGQLWLDTTGGQVALQHAAVTLGFPSLFRWPLPIDELRGHVAWEVDGAQWRVSGRELEASNADVTTSATLDVIHDAAHASPFMSLVADFKDGDGSQVARYLPAGIMPKAAVDWLDEAFVSAKLVSGGAVFHGYLKDFPFDKGNGKFEVAFAVKDASLNYANAWPPITDISANVKFEGRSLLVDAQAGNIFSNQLHGTQVSIADMTAKPMLLKVKGEAQGSTQEKLDYLVSSPPLYAAFGQYLEGMTATGDSLLSLDLALPIGGHQQTQVNGWVDLENNTLSIPPLGQVLNAANGRLTFTQDGLWVERMPAELLGQATQININTEQQHAQRTVRIKASGKFTAPELAARYLPVVTDLLSGDGNWDVLFDIPLSEKSATGKSQLSKSERGKPELVKPEPSQSEPGKTGASKSDSYQAGDRQPDAVRAATLYVQTNLKGVAARFPPPFDKKAEDAGSLELRVNFLPKQSPVMRVNYAGFVDGILTLNDPASAKDFRAEVRFNAGVATLPDTPGLHVLGWLDTVSLDEWRYLFLKPGAKPGTKQQIVSEQDVTPGPTLEAKKAMESGAEAGDASISENPLPILSSADVAIRLFEAYGQQLHNFRVKLRAQNEGLQAEIEGKELKGNLTVPYHLRASPVRADLAYCYLNKAEVGEGTMDPRDMPALDIRIADFRYLNSRFGPSHLETTRVTDGMRIEQLVLNPNATVMTARGGWYLRGNQQQSNLQMHVESSNIGRTLKALDYVGGIDDGKGTVDVELQWPGSLAEVDASRIQGKLSMSLKDGYVLDVDPGAGRMFGMLSIQTLPRRLLLDFSDVFKKGFGFDRLKGNFSIEHGDAYTKDLYMDGPAARVDISGRTGLAKQDYDQLVTVTPHVAESLPLLGVLTATPQVGAVILFVQKLFQPQIDVVTRNQYTIKGSWNAPEIKKVKHPKSVVAPIATEEP